LRIFAPGQEEGTNRELCETVSYQAVRAVPLLLAEKNTALLEKLCEATLDLDREGSLRHYVAFHYLQGSLDRQIAHFQKLARQEREREKANEVLFFLHRARGDFEAARDAAVKARCKRLLVGLLEENGRWQDLASLKFSFDDPEQ